MSLCRRFRLMAIVLFLFLVLSTGVGDEQKKKKKSLLDYTDAELEQLYEEWEENDEEKLADDELPAHRRPDKQPHISLEELQHKAGDPEELMRAAKKGQTVMMFVNVIDADNPARPPASRGLTNRVTSLWQTSLFNAHIDSQVFLIEDYRAIFMFTEGSQAFEAKRFLMRQREVDEITLEGNIWRATDGEGKHSDELKESVLEQQRSEL